jgi:hypothetical protein
MIGRQGLGVVNVHPWYRQVMDITRWFNVVENQNVFVLEHHFCVGHFAFNYITEYTLGWAIGVGRGHCFTILMEYYGFSSKNADVILLLKSADCTLKCPNYADISFFDFFGPAS